MSNLSVSKIEASISPKGKGFRQSFLVQNTYIRPLT